MNLQKMGGKYKMRYSKYLRSNEEQAVKNGEREVVKYDELIEFLGDTDNMIECLMDIINNQYAVEDFISDIKDYA